MQDTRERDFIIKVILEMKRRKMSMNKLAREIDVSVLTVRCWITGVKGLKLKNYYRLREYLNIKD